VEVVFTRRLAITALLSAGVVSAASSIQPKKNEPQFQTSDRCLACYKSLSNAMSAGNLALALSHMQHHTLAIDIFYFEMP
jgi:hypothetical protein